MEFTCVESMEGTMTSAENNQLIADVARDIVAQIARVHKLSYERFLQLKLSDMQANRLADAIAASLITDPT